MSLCFTAAWQVCVHLELVNGQEKEEAKIWVSPQACIGEVKQQAEDELQVVISKLQLPSGCFIDGHRSVEEERLDENVKIRALAARLVFVHDSAAASENGNLLSTCCRTVCMLEVATREDLDFKMRLQQARCYSPTRLRAHFHLSSNLETHRGSSKGLVCDT